MARRRGFTDALPTGSLLLDHVLSAPASMQGGRDAMARLLPPGEPIALFCSSDAAAAGAMIEAASRGVAVPGDLAVCGFGDLEVGRAMNPPISTVSVDGAEIGRTAARCLLGRLAGQEGPRRIAIPFRIEERGSTRNLRDP